MFTGLTDLIHQLQDFSTQHSGDETQVRVEVPTSVHGLEQFEIESIHQEGPAIVLECQPSHEEKTQPHGTRQHRVESTRACIHNDYEDLS